MSTEVAVQAEDPTETQLKQFEVNPEYTKDSLKALALKYASLKVTDVTDKLQVKAVHDARMDIKDKRVEIEKIGKKMREGANSFIKAVIKRQDELVAEISSTEYELEKEEDRVKDELAAIKKKKEEAIFTRTQERIEKLRLIGAAHDWTELRDMTEEQFGHIVEDATLAHLEKQKADEEARIERDRLAKEEDDRQEKVRQDQEAERIRLQAIADEQAKRQQEIEAKEQKMRDDADKLLLEREETRKAQVEAVGMVYSDSGDGSIYNQYSASFPNGDRISWQKETSQELFKDAVRSSIQTFTDWQAAETLREKKEAEDLAEKKRLEDEAKAAKELLDKAAAEEKAREDLIEAQRVAAEAEQERLAELPDAEKFMIIAHSLDGLMNAKNIWEMKSKKGGIGAKVVLSLLTQAKDKCATSSNLEKKP